MPIRPYEPSDWPRLCAIHDPARLDELQQAGLADAFLPLEVAAEREGLFDYDVLVAELDGVVCGFAAASDDELAWLYVDPACQRRGVGRALAQAVIQARPGAVAVEVLQGNVAALGFYRALGFVETELVSGRMPGHEQFEVTVHCLVRR